MNMQHNPAILIGTATLLIAAALAFPYVAPALLDV